MHFSSKVIVASFLPLALAQYGTPAGGSSSTSSAATPATSSGIQTVTVGAGGILNFSPNTITAVVGSSIEFVFNPATHSVAQSSFNSPCAPLASGAGFYSGLFKTTNGTNANAFTIMINDTNPIWFYCSVPSHCELGMAGVINAPSDGSATLAQYKAAAAKVSNTTAPTTVQGGSIGPVKVATDGSSTSSAPTASATKNTGVKGAVTDEGAKWLVMTLTGLFALGVGGLMI